MADITPITREEFYLAKAGGQDVPIPSAVTRKEYYLEKLSNDNVDVPTPVTRREKFLYFACGGEIDLPSEEKMTRLERLIAKAGGMDVSTPTAVTRLEKLWANVEGGGWKTLTGVLPLTFTAKGGTAVDWVIYGNDDVGENHWHQNAYSTTINDVSISADTSSLTISSNGSSTSISVTDNVWKNAIKTLIGSGEYTYQYAITGTHTNMAIGFYKSDNTIVFTSNQNTYSETFTSDNGEYYNGFYLPKGWSGNITVTQMLVKGSTAPEHYIPYQQGVGERTVNLFDCRKNNNNYTDATVAGVRFLYGNQSITLSQTANDRYPQQQIKGEDGVLTLAKNTQYYGKLYIDNAPENANIYMLLQASTDGTNYTTITTIRSAWVTFTPNDDYTVYRWLFVAEGDGITYNNTVVKFSITKGSTAPSSYVPYGYEIPLKISQQGQPDKTYDIYIGDSPLTEGETVSKTSTGVDIELFNGENTVSTTLYNKPAMKIKYK